MLRTRHGIPRFTGLILAPFLAAAFEAAPGGAPVQFPLQGYDVTYFTSLKWVETRASVSEDGEIKGEVVLWNQDVTDLCSQVVFAVADATGRVLTYFGGASGCIRGKAVEETTIHKSLKVKGHIHPNYLVNATQLLAKAIPDEKAVLTPDLIRHLFPPGAHRNES